MKKIIISNSILHEMYISHINGLSIKELSRRFLLGENVIRKAFIKNNFHIINRQYPNINKKKSKIPQSRINVMIEMYSHKHTLKEISKIVGDSPSQVMRILNANSINTKFDFSNQQYRKKIQTYSINENFFNNIDTQEKAYILGFLYADGNANKNLKQITLKLQEKDKYILELISKLIGSNKPLHFSSRRQESHQNQYALKITNTVIYSDLIKYGVIPNKTFKTEFPFVLEPYLWPHFIRGYFDGDGCFYIDNKRSCACWSIIGSSAFCLSLLKILNDKIKVKGFIIHDRRCSDGVDIIRVRKYSDIKKICNWIYADSRIHLDRKFNKFLKMKEIKNDIV